MMLDPEHIPAVASEEVLARYVVSRRHFSKAGVRYRVKQDAFIPPPSLELSVTRHREATEGELWELGNQVAAQRDKTLYGRGDVSVARCLSSELRVKADGLKDNPNHAIVVGWPENDKGAQKLIAQKIAADTKFVPLPEFHAHEEH